LKSLNRYHGRRYQIRSKGFELINAQEPEPTIELESQLIKTSGEADRIGSGFYGETFFQFIDLSCSLLEHSYAADNWVIMQFLVKGYIAEV